MEFVLHDAIKSNINLSEFEELVFSGKYDINQVDDEYQRPLSIALSEYRSDIALFLIEMGANINIKVNKEPILTFILAELDIPSQLELFNLLISNPQLGVDMTDDSLNIPLAFTITSYHAGKLLELGSNPNSRNIDGETPIFNSIAEDQDSKEHLKILLEYGADINVQDYHGNTPIHKLADEGFWDSIYFFIENGARVDIKNNEGILVGELIPDYPETQKLRDKIYELMKYDLWVNQENQSQKYDNMFQWLPIESLYLPKK